MILGFKDRFVPLVEEGSKTHTIRKGDRWRVGMLADLYARPRQPGMRLLFGTEVVEVMPARLDFTGDAPLIFACGHRLTEEQMHSVAWKDGFRPTAQPGPECIADMVSFFGPVLLVGQLVHWRFPGVSK